MARHRLTVSEALLKVIANPFRCFLAGTMLWLAIVAAPMAEQSTSTTDLFVKLCLENGGDADKVAAESVTMKYRPLRPDELTPYAAEIFDLEVLQGWKIDERQRQSVVLFTSRSGLKPACLVDGYITESEIQSYWSTVSDRHCLNQPPLNFLLEAGIEDFLVTVRRGLGDPAYGIMMLTRESTGTLSFKDDCELPDQGDAG